MGNRILVNSQGKAYMTSGGKTLISPAIPSETPVADSVRGCLIMWLDGIKNAGADVGHSSAATTWADLSGTGNDGTINGNAIEWGEDHLTFDGSTNWVNCGQNTPGNLTLEICYRMAEDAAVGCALAANYESGGYAILSGNAGCFIDGSYRWCGISVFGVPGIHVLTLVYDGVTQRYYVDGIQKSLIEIRNYIRLPNNDTVLAISGNPNGSSITADFFKGDVFSARLWNCGFSDDIIAGLATETMARFRG